MQHVEPLKLPCYIVVIFCEITLSFQIKNLFFY